MTVAEALRSTRNDSRKSQEFMALEIGVTRRTVQNWECGISEPTVSQAITWYKLLHKNPLPYILQNVYPDVDKISPKDTDDKILEALLQIINDLPPDATRQLLYLFFGNHGSSPRAILQMITAHLQTPMKERISHGQLIATDYEIAKLTGELCHPEHIQPDFDFLNTAIAAAKATVANNDTDYFITNN